METETKRLIAVVGTKMAACRELKKKILTLNTVYEDIVEHASEEKTFGRWKNDKCCIEMTMKRAFICWLWTVGMLEEARPSPGWNGGAAAFCSWGEC